MAKTKNDALAAGLRKYASGQIGVSLDDAALFREAADRIEELASISRVVIASLRHDSALPHGCPACAMRERLVAFGVIG